MKTPLLKFIYTLLWTLPWNSGHFLDDKQKMFMRIIFITHHLEQWTIIDDFIINKSDDEYNVHVRFPVMISLHKDTLLKFIYALIWALPWNSEIYCFPWGYLLLRWVPDLAFVCLQWLHVCLVPDLLFLQSKIRIIYINQVWSCVPFAWPSLE